MYCQKLKFKTFLQIYSQVDKLPSLSSLIIEPSSSKDSSSYLIFIKFCQSDTSFKS